MAVGNIQTTTQVYSATIVTSDPTTGTVDAVMAGNQRTITVTGTPVAFRWPVAGEVWRIKNINGSFYLESPWPIQDNSPVTAMTAANDTMVTINSIEPGDAVINSPTGKVWVLGSQAGSTDFNFSGTEYTYAPATAPSAPSEGFTVYVDEVDGKLKTIASSGKITILATP